MISEFYDPDPAAGQRVAEAATALAGRGHAVRVLARLRRGQEKRSGRNRNGVTVERLWGPIEPGFGLPGKALAAGWFQLVAVVRALCSRKRFDVLVTVSTPPMNHVAGVLVARVRRAKHVFWCADVNPQQVIATGGLSSTSVLARLLKGANHWALQRCDGIIAVGRCMRELLISLGAPGERVTIVPMWQRDGLANGPDPALLHELRDELGLEGRFVVRYSGNLGRVHHFESLLAAAERFREDVGVVFFFSGSGPGVERVRRSAEARGLRNVLIYPLFPEEILGEALALASVHVITLRPSARGVSVPGKVYGAMASARPVIFLGPEGSEAALTLQEESCGMVIAPEDTDALTQVLEQLRAHPAEAETLGLRGREAFLRRHCQSVRCAQFSQTVERVFDGEAEGIHAVMQ